MFDCRYWLWLSLIFEPGSVACDSLLQAFDQNPKSIYEADENTLAQLCKNNTRALTRLCDKTLDNVYSVLELCEKENIGILTQDSPLYPSSLMNIVGKPPVIYYKGVIPDFTKKLAIGVVGTRNVTNYGVSSAYTISHDLASAGAIVVSGMALGTDTAAHRGALDAKGCTVAFLGSGINVVYPKENAHIMQEIIEKGAVMSDYPPNSRPEGRHFPIRNRLISGVSNGVLVIEAAAKSGALITASHALKQGKLLYAIPGKIGDLSSVGTNDLIRNGAKTVTSSADILSDFSGLYELKSPSFAYKHSNRSNSKASHSLDTPYQTPSYSKNNDKNKIRKNDTQQNNSVSYDSPISSPYAYLNEDSQNRIYVPVNNPDYVPLTLNDPRPTILYRGYDGEIEEFEDAKSFGSIKNYESPDAEELIDILGHKQYLTYPKDPIPENGYEAHLTEEKIKYFDKISERAKNRVPKGAKFEIETPFKPISDLHELYQMHIDAKAEHEERVKLKAELKEKGEPDYIGMSESEIKVYKYISEKGKIGVDSMGDIGLPLSKLLSVLTVLEIKRKISQLPGGYFEIRNDS